MKTKRRIILITAITLTVAYTVGVFLVNKNALQAKDIVYQKGEVVDFGNDYVDSYEDAKPGYAIAVLGYELIDTQTFYREYHLSDEENLDTSFTPYYCLVKVRFYNKDSDLGENGGISLAQLPLVGDDYLCQVSENVFCAMYPDMPGMNFSLRKGTSMVFDLPYPLDVVTGKTREDLIKKSPWIEISEYPNRKRIEIK